MTVELERYQPRAVERLEVNVVKAIANTDLIPKSIRGNVPAIMATILKGRALGLDDMHALTAIHFIEGKPTLSAETMVLVVRRAGHSIVGDFGEGAVTAKGRRGDTGDEMSVTWTIAMAQRANLTGKDNWKRYPEAMLWARAVSQLCRMLFADALAGVGYTPDEAELSPEDRVSEAIGDVKVPADTEKPDDVVDAADAAWEPVSPVEDSEGEPEAPPVVSPADTHEPGSPSELPPETAGQGSIFASMAETAQTKKRGHRDPS